MKTRKDYKIYNTFTIIINIINIYLSDIKILIVVSYFITI